MGKKLGARSTPPRIKDAGSSRVMVSVGVVVVGGGLAAALTFGSGATTNAPGSEKAPGAAAQLANSGPAVPPTTLPANTVPMATIPAWKAKLLHIPPPLTPSQMAQHRQQFLNFIKNLQEHPTPNTNPNACGPWAYPTAPALKALLAAHGTPVACEKLGTSWVMTTTTASRIEVGQLNCAPTDAPCLDGRQNKNLSQFQWSDGPPGHPGGQSNGGLPSFSYPDLTFVTFTPVPFGPPNGRAVYNILTRTWSLEAAA
ncbi:MAG: hypothetical protein ACP5P1_14890 [Acidimicrobiales bacterium]